MTTFPTSGRQPAVKAGGEQSSGTSSSLPAQHCQLAGENSIKIPCLTEDEVTVFMKTEYSSLHWRLLIKGSKSR